MYGFNMSENYFTYTLQQNPCNINWSSKWLIVLQNTHKKETNDEIEIGFDTFVKERDFHNMFKDTSLVLCHWDLFTN